MEVALLLGILLFLQFTYRLKRLDESANIKVFEKGPYNAFANCGLPYYVGGIIPKVIAMFFFSYLGKRSFSF